jgi:hypothetical protein
LAHPFKMNKFHMESRLATLGDLRTCTGSLPKKTVPVVFLSATGAILVMALFFLSKRRTMSSRTCAGPTHVGRIVCRASLHSPRDQNTTRTSDCCTDGNGPTQLATVFWRACAHNVGPAVDQGANSCAHARATHNGTSCRRGSRRRRVVACCLVHRLDTTRGNATRSWAPLVLSNSQLQKACPLLRETAWFNVRAVQSAWNVLHCFASTNVRTLCHI